MADTKIEWADAVWNPVVGCRKVSEGCRNCYAEKMAVRLAAMGRPEYQAVVTESGKWTGSVKCLPERLSEPSKWKKPRRVFVNSMSDLFHEDVPFDFILRCWIVMASNPQHTFIILTKRAAKMNMFIQDWLPGAWGLATMSMKLLEEPIKNIWLGVSAENQKAADERIPWLLKTPAAVRFVSVEPMLGAVDIVKAMHCGSVKEPIDPVGHIDWCIVGGESGPGARPMQEQWARDLKDQCVTASVPFFYKQGPDDSGKLVKMPALDGQVWAQYPEVN